MMVYGGGVGENCGRIRSGENAPPPLSLSRSMVTPPLRRLQFTFFLSLSLSLSFFVCKEENTWCVWSRLERGGRGGVLSNLILGYSPDERVRSLHATPPPSQSCAGLAPPPTHPPHYVLYACTARGAFLRNMTYRRAHMRPGASRAGAGGDNRQRRET